MDPNTQQPPASIPQAPITVPAVPAIPVNNKKNLLIWIIAAVVIIILSFMTGFLFINKTNAATISGIINFTALKPEPTDKGTINIKYRKYGSSDVFQPVNTTPKLAEGASWSWNGAISGQPYEMVADLVVDNKVVTASEPIIVTAPASKQTLDLHVTWHNLPSSVTSEQLTHIQGTVNIQGYIPPGSVLTILAKSSGQSNYQTVYTTNNPGSSNSWKWDGVKPLQDFTLKAVLTSNKFDIGTSPEVTAAGGDGEINLLIKSGANFTPADVPTPTPAPASIQATSAPTPTPQPTTGTISGVVTTNGPIANNSSLLMLWRKPGDANYQVITRINNPSSQQSWQWNSPIIGEDYEITVALQVNNNNTASALSQIVVAPAQNINFTLNSGVTINTPGAMPTISACSQLNNNQYNLTIQWPIVQQAGSYWLQLGQNPGASNILSSVVPAGNNSSNQLTTSLISASTNYYAQYAYSYCNNCSSPSNFSNFSSASRMFCGTDPGGGGSGNYTGYNCNSSLHACQLSTDPNATYNFNNTGLAQCQTACAAPTPTPLPPTPTPTPSITIQPAS